MGKRSKLLGELRVKVKLSKLKLSLLGLRGIDSGVYDTVSLRR